MREVGLRVRLRTVLTVAAALAATVLAGACGDDGDDPPASTPTVAATVTSAPPTPTPSTLGCPVHDDICAHARTLEAALRSGDIDAVIGATQGDPVTCAGGAVQPLAPTWPLCDGAAAGEVRYGVRKGGYQSETSLVTVDEMAKFIGEWRDDQASAGDAGTLRAWTIGCSVADQTCDRAYAIVFSLPNGISLLNINYLRADGSAPALSMALSGLASLNRELIDGGEHGVPIPPYNDPVRPVDYVPLLTE